MAWFDCICVKYGCMLQGATEICLTMLDVLGYLDKIPVCVGYSIDESITDTFPLPHLLNRSKPVYEYLDGWKCDISDVTDYDRLPEQAKEYINFVENKIGVPVTMISVGPKRNQIIFR